MHGRNRPPRRSGGGNRVRGGTNKSKHRSPREQHRTGLSEIDSTFRRAPPASPSSKHGHGVVIVAAQPPTKTPNTKKYQVTTNDAVEWTDHYTGTSMEPLLKHHHHHVGSGRAETMGVFTYLRYDVRTTESATSNIPSTHHEMGCHSSASPSNCCNSQDHG